MKVYVKPTARNGKILAESQVTEIDLKDEEFAKKVGIAVCQGLHDLMEKGHKPHEVTLKVQFFK